MSSLRQTTASAAAFEIRFSTTDSELEILEIQSDINSQVPEPFKKRDKIPRSSGSIEQLMIINSNINSNSNSSNSNNNSNNNTAAPVRHSSLDSQVPPLVLKSRHHVNGDNLNGLTKKGMSTNSVGPEAINNGIKNNSLTNVNDLNVSDDDLSISRNLQYKKQRSSTIDLNGKTDPVVSNNKIIMPKNNLKNKKINMLTNNHKDDENKSNLATPPDTPPISPYIISSATPVPLSDSDIINQLNLEESESQLITPPPSSSSARSSGESLSRTQQMPRSSKKRRGSQSSQLSNEFQPAKLQSSRGRRLSSTERSITTSEDSSTIQLPNKRRGSQSSQLSNEFQPASKLQSPRGRRLSSAERPTITSEEPSTIQLPNKSQTPQQSQPIPIRSRIPRLSMSSRERPDIVKKISQGSLSLSSQESNQFNNDSKESLSSSYPVTSKSQPSRGLRAAISRPIINTSFVTDMEIESESPTSYSPTSYSSTSYSPPNHSPTSMMSHSLPKRSQISHPPPVRSSTSPAAYQKKLTISHDDIIVPTVAKKLKMNGQLHFVNHDALLGYSEEPENMESPTTENGYMDITDQVVDLFDGSRGKSHKSHKPVHGSQRRLQQSVRKNSSTGHSRNSSKTHYVAPRKQNFKPPSQQTFEEPSSPTNSQFENSSNHSTFVDDDYNKQRKSRREEYIMVIHDDDDDMELIEPQSSTPSVSSDPSVPPEPIEPIEPITAPTEQVEIHDQTYQGEKIEEPAPVQILPAVQETLNPAEIISVSTTTSSKTKKGKKKQKKGSSEKQMKGNGDSDEVHVRRSMCRCM